MEFSEHRKYVYGDSPRTIDWRLFGRTDKLYTKKFEAETNLQCHLVVDTSASMDYHHGGHMSKLDYAICTAAALAYMLTRQQDPVGLILIDDQLRMYMKPRTKMSHLTDMIAVLSKAEAGQASKLADSLRAGASLINRAGLVILLTDLYQDQGEDSKLVDAIQELRYRGHDVILFHVLDQAEVDFDFGGPITFTDRETGESMTVDAGGLRESYQKELNEFRDSWQQACGAAEVDFVPLDTGTPFDKALMSFLHRRLGHF